MPRRARERRTTPLAALQQQLDRATGDGTCVALILPLLGLAMRCQRPCTRCRGLADEVERLRPEWDAAREQYRREHPTAALTRAPLANEGEFEEDEL